MLLKTFTLSGFIPTGPGSHYVQLHDYSVFLVQTPLSHEGDGMLDLRRSLYSLPWVYLDVSLLPAVSLDISEDRRAKHCVSFTRPTSSAPPPSIRQGQSSENRDLLKVYFLLKITSLGYLVRSVKHDEVFPSWLSKIFFTFWTSSWRSVLSIRHLGM